jgi:1-aminocyclopropane-1-carboxylate deaminase/D-cysteine desulfhydrase
MQADTKTSIELGSHFDVLPEIQSFPLEIAKDQLVTLDCLRLDRIHPFISGNKWYKLKHHLMAAMAAGKSRIISFGGAHSNHLHAMAYAANQLNLSAVGIVRGEAREALSPTLQDCKKWGMDIQWMDRESYRNTASSVQPDMFQQQYPDSWTIPEGGAGRQGTIGIQSLFNSLHHRGLLNYDLIACGVGSGATLAGIAQANIGRAHCLGFSALKNAHDLEQRVEKQLAGASKVNPWRICHDYHFGGFAKINARLTEFISKVYDQHELVLDPVYTSKMMYGLAEYIHQGRIQAGARVLAIHTGGLQGWRGFGESYQHFLSS